MNFNNIKIIIKMSTKCVVLVTDKNFLEKTFSTIHQIRNIGNYEGDIVVLPHMNLLFDKWLAYMAEEYNVKLKFFAPIDLQYIYKKFSERPFQNVGFKRMQWHKLHLFDEYFKQWDSILYMDAGMQIFDDINIFWELVVPGKLIAHSDDYPNFTTTMKRQFDSVAYPEIYSELNNKINLNRSGFQSTMMLFDTSIIEQNTKKILIDIANKYHIMRTNEQGTMNIYFNGLYNIWEPLATKYNGKFTYDFWERGNFRFKDYVMLKYPKTLHIQ